MKQTNFVSATSPLATAYQSAGLNGDLMQINAGLSSFAIRYGSKDGDEFPGRLKLTNFI